MQPSTGMEEQNTLNQFTFQVEPPPQFQARVAFFLPKNFDPWLSNVHIIDGKTHLMLPKGFGEPIGKADCLSVKELRAAEACATVQCRRVAGAIYPALISWPEPLDSALHCHVDTSTAQ